MNNQELTCREAVDTARLFSTANDKDSFVEFLTYCAERLSKGDSVQAIWRDYQESIC